MKFVHISDLHIGKSVNGFPMLEDQRHALGQVLKKAIEEKVDGAIIAGDVYDRPAPSAEAVALLDWFLTELFGQGIEVFLISGNHDSPERLGFAGRLLEQGGLHVAGMAEKEGKEVICEDSYGKLHVYLLPFSTAKAMAHMLGMEGAEASYHRCVQALTERMAVNPEERNLLVTHHFVAGNGQAPVLSDSESHLSVGGIDLVDGGIWKDFDYVALGHIHRPQKVGRATARYAGSLLKYSFSEAYHQKTMTIVELREKGQAQVEEFPILPLHDMRILKGRLSDLIREDVVRQGDPEDYLQVTLTDPGELFEPMAQLRSVYPNVMQLILEKHKAVEERTWKASEKLAKKSTLELFGQFYEAVMERPLDQEQQKAAEQAMREIGE